jgi:putative Mg2+ transporter-C (MgtC) family protein
MSFVEFSFQDLLTNELSMAVRLMTSVGLGGLLGWDREYKNRPAGLRTHILVCLASTTFTIITLEISKWASAQDTPADPLRAVEAVTAGVAFLAAGTIIQSRGKVSGLTTGAGLWLVGAVGVACGAGMFALAFIVATMSFVVLAGLQGFSDWIGRDRNQN